MRTGGETSWKSGLQPELTSCSDSYLCCWKCKAVWFSQLHGNMKEPVLSEGVMYTNAFKAWAWEWVWGRRGAGPNPPSLAHTFLCVFYNKAFVQGSQIEVHVRCPLVFYKVSLPSPTSLLSSEKKQEKAMKECCWKEMHRLQFIHLIRTDLNQF